MKPTWQFALLVALVALTLLLAAVGCAGPLPTAEGWIMVGHTPDGAEVAIEVVAEAYPELPRSGIVTWSDGPFSCLTAAKDSMGCTFPTQPPSIEVMFLPKVEETALVYELGNVLHVAPDQSQALGDWSAIMNAEVSRRLGR